MNGAGIQQRCWNHEGREAVCRCPECGRSFCRECVTEHEARLLCSACLGRLAQAAAVKRGAFERVLPLGMVLAGIVLGWGIFFGAAEALVTTLERGEQAAWQNR
jgi:hypothetical protein